MHDWMFEAGGEPLSLTLAEQPGSPAPVAADWFSHEPADDFETWLFETPAKGDPDDFGPMFGEGEGEGEDDDDGAHELDEVVVTGRRVEGFPTAVQVTIGDYGDTQDPTGLGGRLVDGLTDNLFAWIDSFLDRWGDTALELAERDGNSTFDRSRAQPLDRNGRHVGYIYDDGTFWYDRNGNGQPETHLRWFGNELWQDTDFNGSWDRRVR